MDAQWTFLTNHAHVLLSIVKFPAIRMRELAEKIGITERAVQRIIADLEDAGHLQIERQGRRNSYKVFLNLPLRHPIERHCSVKNLVKLIDGTQHQAIPRQPKFTRRTCILPVIQSSEKVQIIPKNFGMFE
ncbi:MAG: MarR family transcriptional regulator [Candidatus Riflebacteria bacterium]|nr:MarR family transcriptional regulator [Candidatus Riflebacteria bacterium]